MAAGNRQVRGAMLCMLRGYQHGAAMVCEQRVVQCGANSGAYDGTAALPTPPLRPRPQRRTCTSCRGRPGKRCCAAASASASSRPTTQRSMCSLGAPGLPRCSAPSSAAGRQAGRRVMLRQHTEWHTCSWAYQRCVWAGGRALPPLTLSPPPPHPPHPHPSPHTLPHPSPLPTHPHPPCIRT